MPEIADIAKALEQAAQVHEPTWLATVVSVEGSAYRRPGARLLFGREGKLAGGLSGGCVDREVERTGAWLSQRGPVLRSYDGRLDEVGVGARTGCGGKLQVLIEPVTRELGQLLVLAGERVGAEQRVALATVVASRSPLVELGQRLLRCGSTSLGTLSHEACKADLGAALSSLGLVERARPLRSIHGGFEALLEILEPAPHCFVFGAGEDAVPVARFAGLLDWNVTICAAQSQFMTRTRFIGLGRVKAGGVAEGVAELDRCARPLAIVMGHDYQRDRATLAALLRSKCRYIGMLGPTRRTERMLRELRATEAFSAERLGCVYGPVGLHLGAETPTEIALSIVAEAQAVLAQAEGGSLRDRRSGIHEQEALQLLSAEGA